MEPDEFFLKWSERSRMLALTLARIEANTGPEGFPLEWELDPDNDGWFEAEPVVNFATAARERYLNDHKNLEPGTRILIRYTKEDKPKQ